MGTYQKEVAVAVAVLGLFIAAALPAHAQLAVSDAPTEANTYWLTQQGNTLISNTTSIAENDLKTANSLTIGGGGGWYVPNASFLASLNTPLFATVNQQGFTTLFPGWQKLSDTSTLNAQNVTSRVLATYQGAMSDTQQQMSELTGEDFSAIATDSQTTISVLHELQDVVTSNLIIAQELQTERQQIATLTQVVATQAAEILNSKAQAQATASFTVLGTGE